METGQFAELNQPGHDHLDIDIGRVMAQVNQAASLWAKLARAIISRAPIVVHSRVKCRLVILVLDEDAPIVRQRFVNFAHALKVALERAPEVLLSREISTVADPNCMRFRAECFPNLDAFDIVFDGLAAHSFVGMRKATEFIRQFPRLILKGI